jgi:hypothetical protein
MTERIRWEADRGWIQGLLALAELYLPDNHGQRRSAEDGQSYQEFKIKHIVESLWAHYINRLE